MKYRLLVESDFESYDGLDDEDEFEDDGECQEQRLLKSVNIGFFNLERWQYDDGYDESILYNIGKENQDAIFWYECNDEKFAEYHDEFIKELSIKYNDICGKSFSNTDCDSILEIIKEILEKSP